MQAQESHSCQLFKSLERLRIAEATGCLVTQIKWGFRRTLISRGRHYIHIIKIKVIVFAACRKIIPQDRLLNDQQLGQPLSCLQEELQKSHTFLIVIHLLLMIRVF